MDIFEYEIKNCDLCNELPQDQYRRMLEAIRLSKISLNDYQSHALRQQALAAIDAAEADLF